MCRSLRARSGRLVAMHVAIVLAVAVSPPRRAAAQGARARWYAIHLAGAPAGWMRESTASNDSGVSVTTAMHLALNRLGTRVSMEMSASTLETAAGELVSATGSMRLSDQLVETQASVLGDSMRVRSRAGGRDFIRMLPIPRLIVGPSAIDRRCAA